MKISQQQLKQLIKEELAKVLSEVHRIGHGLKVVRTPLQIKAIGKFTAAWTRYIKQKIQQIDRRVSDADVGKAVLYFADSKVRSPTGWASMAQAELGAAFGRAKEEQKDKAVLDRQISKLMGGQ